MKFKRKNTGALRFLCFVICILTSVVFGVVLPVYMALMYYDAGAARADVSATTLVFTFAITNVASIFFTFAGIEIQTEYLSLDDD
jgi:hypothetical protein